MKFTMITAHTFQQLKTMRSYYVTLRAIGSGNDTLKLVSFGY